MLRAQPDVYLSLVYTETDDAEQARCLFLKVMRFFLFTPGITIMTVWFCWHEGCHQHLENHSLDLLGKAVLFSMRLMARGLGFGVSRHFSLQ